MQLKSIQQGVISSRTQIYLLTLHGALSVIEFASADQVHSETEARQLMSEAFSA